LIDVKLHLFLPYHNRHICQEHFWIFDQSKKKRPLGRFLPAIGISS